MKKIILSLMLVFTFALLAGQVVNEIVTPEGYAWTATQENMELNIIFSNDGVFQAYLMDLENMEQGYSLISDGTYTLKDGKVELIISKDDPHYILYSFDGDKLVVHTGNESNFEHAMTPFLKPKDDEVRKPSPILKDNLEGTDTENIEIQSTQSSRSNIGIDDEEERTRLSEPGLTITPYNSSIHVAWTEGSWVGVGLVTYYGDIWVVLTNRADVTNQHYQYNSIWTDLPRNSSMTLNYTHPGVTNNAYSILPGMTYYMWAAQRYQSVVMWIPTGQYDYYWTSRRTVTIPAVGNPPRNVTAIPGNRSVTLNWVAPASGTVLSYRVYMRKARATTDVNAYNYNEHFQEIYRDIPAGELSFSINNTLSNLTAYEFQVRAWYSGGGSGASNTVTVTPAVFYPLISPTSTILNNGIRLQWGTPNSATGAASLSSYRVDRKTGTGAWSSISSSLSIATSQWTDTSAQFNTQYQYRIVAIYTNPASPTEPTTNQTSPIPHTIVPNPPLSLAGELVSSRASLVWSAPSTTDRLGTLAYYRVYRKLSSSTQYTQVYQTPNASTTTWYDPFIIENAIYEYQVTAVYTSPSGESARSNTARVSDFDGRPTNYFVTGAGRTEANAYLISNIENLQWLSEAYDDWWVDANTTIWFKQTADIDATNSLVWNGGNGFRPIGNSTGQFVGVYDGGGYTISNLYMYSQSSGGRGGFINTAVNSTIRNTHLNNISVVGDFSTVGSIVVTCSGSSISNCSATGNIALTLSNWFGNSDGGLIGVASGVSTILNSWSDIEFTGIMNYIGGIVGLTQGTTTLKNCHSFGNANISSPGAVGGLVGVMWGETLNIRNSYSFMNLNISSNVTPGIGGIAGVLNGSTSTTTTIQETYFAGNINSDGTVGGLVGDINTGSHTLQNNFWDTSTSGIANAIGSGTASGSNNFGLPTAFMWLRSTYTDVGWDFYTVWDMSHWTNNGYPYLRDMPAAEHTPIIFPDAPGLARGFQVENGVRIEWNKPEKGFPDFYRIIRNGYFLADIYPNPSIETPSTARFYVDNTVDVNPPSEQRYQYVVEAHYMTSMAIESYYEQTRGFWVILGKAILSGFGSLIGKEIGTGLLGMLGISFNNNTSAPVPQHIPDLPNITPLTSQEVMNTLENESSEGMIFTRDPVINPSNPVEIIILPGPPAAPQNLRFATMVSTQVHLTWDHYTANPSDVTRYFVYRNGVQVNDYGVDPDDRNFIDGNLINGNVYRYHVQALHSNGRRSMISNRILARPSPLFGQPANWNDPNAGLIENPYQIATVENLRWMAEWNRNNRSFPDGTINDEGGGWWVNPDIPVHFEITADIDVTGSSLWNNARGFRPIGHELQPSDSRFIGVLNGNGHTIYNLTIDADAIGTTHAGLFGLIINSEIRNLNLENVYIKGNIAGGIAAEVINSIIENVSVTGTIEALGVGGGIAGMMESSTISQCYTNVNVSSEIAGGIAGIISASNIANCYATGKASGVGFEGGLVGMAIGGNIVNSYITSQLDMPRDPSAVYSGSIAGYVVNPANYIIRNNFWNETAYSNITDFGYDNPSAVLTNNSSLTANEMQNAISFTGGWNFTDVWNVCLHNDGMPHLRVFHAQHHFNPVTDLRVSGVSQNGQLTISWVPPTTGSCGSLVGYRVFANGAEVGFTTETSYFDSATANGQINTYYVEAVYENVAGIATSETLEVPIFFSPMLYEQSVSNCSVTLRWDFNYPDEEPDSGESSMGNDKVISSPKNRFALKNSIERDKYSTDIFKTRDDDNSTRGIASYRIFRNEVQIDQVNAPTSAYTDTGVFGANPHPACGNEYLYQIQAVYTNPTGESMLSMPLEITMPANHTFKPTGTLTRTINNGYVVLNWSAPSAGSCGTLYNYKVFRNDVEIATTTANTHTDTDPVNGEINNYYVKATYTNYTGESAASNTVSYTPFNAPMTLQLLAVGNCSVSLSWTPPARYETGFVVLDDENAMSKKIGTDEDSREQANDGTRAVSGYNIFRNGVLLAQNITQTTYDDNCPHTPAAQAHPSCGGTYDYYVVAIYTNPDGTSVASNTVRAIMPATHVFNPPRNLSINNGVLGWNEPEDGSCGHVSEYHVFRNNSEIASVSASDELFFTDPSPVNGLLNTYTVKAIYVNHNGESNPSNAVSWTVYNTPQNLLATLSNSNITLNWSPPLNGITTLSNYRLYRSILPSDDFTQIHQTQNNTTLSYADNTVLSGLTYYYYVIAVYSTGISEPSEIVSIITPITPPWSEEFENTTLPLGWINNGYWYFASGSAYTSSSNFLITPLIHIDSSNTVLEYTAHSQNATIEIWKSTTGTDITDFSFICNENIGNTPQLRSVNLASFTNQNIYIAFKRTAGSMFYLDNVRVGSPTSDADQVVITKTELATNYPNPFNPQTTISFSLVSESDVTVEIYNAKGQKVKTLASGVYKMGRHNLIWNGDDHYGNSVGSGIYFYKMQTTEYSSIKKMLLLK